MTPADDTEGAIAARQQAEAAWWETWWEHDFSWDGLAVHSIGGDGGLHGERSLQDYWARDPGTGASRSQDEMALSGELVVETSATGEAERWWHIAHLPLYWRDGGAAKAAWTVADHSRLDTLVAVLLKAACETEFAYELGQWTGKDGRAQFTGTVLGMAPSLLGEIQTVHVTAAFARWFTDWPGSDRHYGPLTDFTGAQFELARFQNAIFDNICNFDEALFLDWADFRNSDFRDETRFYRSTFTADADFSGTRFDGSADFRKVKFAGAATFSKVAFAEDAAFIGAALSSGDFIAAAFGHRADFDDLVVAQGLDFIKAKFVGEASFRNVVVGGNTRFEDAQFGEAATFIGCNLAGTTDFEAVHFGGDVSFQRAIFQDYAAFCNIIVCGNAFFNRVAAQSTADFRNATFQGSTEFEHSMFNGLATFGGARFGEGCNFRGVRFGETAAFSAAAFEIPGEDGGVRSGDMNFAQTVFEQRAVFNNTRFATDPRHHSGAFIGVRFKDMAFFAGTGTHWIAALDEAEFEKRLLLDDPDEATAIAEFDTRILPAAIAGGTNPRTGDALVKELEGGCRVVKVAMGKARNELVEQRYYRFQLIARRHQPGTPWPEKAASWLYGAASNYGLSLSRPLAGLGVTFIGFALLYAGLAIAADDCAVVIEASRQPARWFNVLSMSASRLFPFGAFDMVSRDWLAALEQVAGPAPVLAARGLATLQSLISVILIFLFGLAIRRRFQVG